MQITFGQGPTCAVVPRHPQKGEYVAEVKELCKCLPSKLAAQLRANTSIPLNKTHPRPNNTFLEARAIKELKIDQSRIILTADKGVDMVARDRQDYINKTQVLLGDKDTYRPISKDPTPKLKNLLI